MSKDPYDQYRESKLTAHDPDTIPPMPEKHQQPSEDDLMKLTEKILEPTRQEMKIAMELVGLQDQVARLNKLHILTNNRLKALESENKDLNKKIKTLEDRNKIFATMIKKMLAPMLAQGMFGEKMVEKIMSHDTEPKKSGG